jgi:hypothetical protein
MLVCTVRLYKGMGLFLAGSALCGLSQDMTQLIVFRAIQGIGLLDGDGHVRRNHIHSAGLASRYRDFGVRFRLRSDADDAVAYCVQHHRRPFDYKASITRLLAGFYCATFYTNFRPDHKGGNNIENSLWVTRAVIHFAFIGLS